ncbi:hypothetical protein DPMN_147085 [Dreissena polymorpha]|uniref:Uncharacterized protein n=1 Tax=Dreissena polymorpha TaxID=45954 RepID=A0A9D4FBJ8_DREPO|nr:hypothetical protein DPMN_147085 [Dreissena polymorpha]
MIKAQVSLLLVEPRFIPVCYRRSTGENQDDSYKLFNAVTIFPGAASVEAGQQPSRVPVNLGLATVHPG